MINPLHEKQCTRRGTIVYKRKPRSPKVSDVLRFATAGSVQRILVGKKLFEQIRSLAISGVEAIEDYVLDPFGPKAVSAESTLEKRIYIIEEEL